MSSNLPVPTTGNSPDKVRITAATHPLRAEREFAFVAAGRTIREAVEECCPPEFQACIVVSINGAYFDRSMWDTVLVSEGDIIVLRATPQGGHGGGGKILSTILTIAVLAVMIWQPEFLFGAGSLFGAGGALGITSAAGGLAAFAATGAIANLVLTGLIGPSTVANANSHSGALPQYTFGVAGIQNEERPYSTVPVVYGRTLVTPPKGAHSYTVISNHYQYLYALFDLGPGPLNISDIKIGTSPIDSFADVTYEVREGRDTDAPLTIYTNAVHQWPLSIGLFNSGDHGSYTTPAGVSNIAVDITAPGGLFDTNGSGQLQTATVYFDLTIKDHTTGSIVFETTIDLFGASTSSIANTYVVGVAEGSIADALPVGEYDVTVTRTSAPASANEGVSACYWTSVRSWGPYSGDILPKNHAKIALTIRATEQLNGDITSLNCIAQRYVQVWNGTSFSEELNTHPAWAAYDIFTGSANARPIDQSRIDLGNLLEWATTYPTAEFNYVFSSRTTVWQALKTVGSAGRALPVIRDGLYGFVFDQTQANPVQMFTSRNISNFTATKTYLDEVDGMEIRYIAETMGWQQHSIYIYAAGKDATTANFNFVSTLDLVGVTSDDWAYKIGSYFFAASILRQTLYSFDTDLDHLACNPGDRVLIQHDVISKGLGAGRIVAHTRDGSSHLATITTDTLFTPDQSTVTVTMRSTGGEIYTRSANVTSGVGTTSFTFTAALDDSAAFVMDGDLVTVSSTTTALLDAVVKMITPKADFKATVTCLDYAPTVHSGDTAVVPPVVNGRIQSFYHTLPVSSIQLIGLTADEDTSLIAAGGSAFPRIHGAFMANMDGLPPATYDVQYKVSTDIGYIALPSLSPDAREFFIPITNTAIGLTYDVRIRGNNASETNPGPWTDSTITITSYLVPPPAPAGLTLTSIVSGVTAVVTPGSGRQAAKYRIYENTTNDFSTAQLGAEGPTATFKVTGLDATTLYYFWATTVNEFGTESAPVGPQSALPLPVTAAVGADVNEFLKFLGDAARDHSDNISELSQALATLALGTTVDFQAIKNNITVTTSNLFQGITDGYTNAVTQATGPDSVLYKAVTAVQATMNSTDFIGIATTVNVLSAQVSTNTSGIAVNASDISGVKAALTGYLGSNAVSTAVSGLQTQVTTNGTNITTNSSNITNLQSALSGYTGSGAVSTAITSLQTQVTTNGTNITTNSSNITSLQSALTGYTGASAVSNAISSLTTTVNSNNTAQSAATTAVDTKVGNFYASGLFRVTTSSTPSGSDARIALEVAATSGGSAYAAALYLDARTGGGSRVTIVADSFYITDGTNNHNPFFYTSGSLYLDSAYIQSLVADKIVGGTLDVGVITAGSITTLHLHANAVTDEGADSSGSLTLNPSEAYEGSGRFKIITSATVTPGSTSSPIVINALGGTVGGVGVGGTGISFYIWATKDGSKIKQIGQFQAPGTTSTWDWPQITYWYSGATGASHTFGIALSWEDGNGGVQTGITSNSAAMNVATWQR